MRWAIGLLAFAWLAAGAPARADSIWSALALLTNEQPARPAPKELEPFADGMRRVFGYNSIYLLAAKKKQIRKGSEQWIVPTQKVFLKVSCIDRDETAYRMQLELYVKKKLVVSSEVRLARGAPLYIRGPSWGRGTLVFVLEVR